MVDFPCGWTIIEDSIAVKLPIFSIHCDRLRTFIEIFFNLVTAHRNDNSKVREVGSFLNFARFFGSSIRILSFQNQTLLLRVFNRSLSWTTLTSQSSVRDSTVDYLLLGQHNVLILHHETCLYKACRWKSVSRVTTSLVFNFRDFPESLPIDVVQFC